MITTKTLKRLFTYLWWLFFGLLIWLIYRSLPEIKSLNLTLHSIAKPWLIAVLVLQIIYFLVYSKLFEASLQAARIHIPFKKQISLLFSSIFINTIAPTLGLGGSVVYADHAVATKQSKVRAIAGSLLAIFVELSVLLLFVTITVIGLLHYSQLTNHELWLFLVFLGLIGLLAAVIVVLTSQSSWLRKLVARLPLSQTWQQVLDQLKKVTSKSKRQRVIITQTYLWGIFLHLVNIASLGFIMVALGQTVPLITVIASYSMIMLFWVASPSPQGVGIVEVAGTAALTSLGINLANAVAIVLLFRGLNYWLPLMIGFVVFSKDRWKDQRTSFRLEEWQIHFVAFATALMAIINIISAVFPTLNNRLSILQEISPIYIQYGSRLGTILAGFALLLLSRELWQRKRNAWLLTIIVLILTAVLHIFKGFDYEETILCLALITLLYVQRNRFYALSDRPSLWRGLRTLILAAFFTLLYGTVGFYMLDNNFSVNFKFADAFHQTVLLFTEFKSLMLYPRTDFAVFFINSVYILGIVAIGYAFILLFQPVLIRERASIRERRQAKKIINQYGQSSLAPINLLPDKRYFFTGSDQVIAFTTKKRFALALGDPIGAADETEKVAKNFVEFNQRAGREAIFYQASAKYLSLYQRLGMKNLLIGHEAVVDLSIFTLQGGENKEHRNLLNSLVKKQYRASLLKAPLSDAVLDQLRMVSAEWLEEHGGQEKQFSMGWFNEDYLQQSKVMAILNEEDKIVAFANVSKPYGDREVALDLMRYGTDAPSGTMQFLVVNLILWAKKVGYRYFSLGLCPLWQGKSKHLKPINSFLSFIYTNFNQFYNFKGLHDFKDKFHPIWVPRYLIYRRSLDLPAISQALISASSGDNYLVSSIGKLITKQV